MKTKYSRIPIGNLVEQVKKWNPQTDKDNQVITYLDISSVSRESKRVEESIEIESYEAPSRARQLVAKDDVLVSTVRPNLNAVAYLEEEFDGATASTGFCVLRAKSNKLDSRYLYYWVRTTYFIDDMVRESTGASYPAVSDSIIKNNEIPLPPLEEQKRIAAILDKADRVRRKRQEAIRLTEELGRSIFLDMFGEQHNYPKSLIGNICKVKGGKRLPIGHQLVSNDTGYPYIRAGNLKKGTTTGELLYLKQETHQAIKRYTISSDDVYITIVGAYIGDVGIIPIELDGANLTENAAKLVVKDNRVTNYFISYFLRSDIGQRQIKSKIKTTGQPKFALFRIEEIEIPIPPIETQKKFQLVIENIDKNNSSMSVHYKESENLFNSLLQRAFRGEL